MCKHTYVETFDHGPGGWFGWTNNFEGPKRLEQAAGALISRSPWWIDYNHAPPGAGYLHMLFCMLTKGPCYGEAYIEAAGINHFVEQAFPANFAGARITLRARGELETSGSHLVLLVQATRNGLTCGWALTGTPVTVTEEWSEQTIVVPPDQDQWTCLGSRHDRTKCYGRVDLQSVLQDVNTNIMLILFPLNIVPMGPLPGDPHLLRAGRDYPVWTSRLPEGYVLLDEIRIEFSS
ncbi:MAG: hypothetical protein ACRD18_04815 [Terriglobia bacterium]